MDMKRILQAMDNVAAKPVEGIDSMAKFLRVVNEADLNQTEAVGDPANITDQVNSYIQYSSGLYQKGTSSIEIKKGLVLPVVFKPIPPSGDSFKIIQANINAANARLPRELQLTPDQLSALVGGADKPYAGATLNEGVNPHKVALPVQMAMQHYQQVTPTTITEKKTGIKKFFQEVQLESEEEASAKRELRNQYASTIAKRVLMKENTIPHTHGPRLEPTAGPGLQNNEPDGGHLGLGETPIAMDPTNANNPLVHSHEKANAMHLKDRIAMARAQLRELAQLAESNELIVWERITRLSKGGMFMGLEQNLEQIRHGITELAKKRKQGGVASRGIDKNIGEGFGDFPTAKQPKAPLAKPKAIKSKSKTGACRSGQTQVGMQNKDGKSVPKCAVKFKK